jgi:hypothetical protein
MGLVLEQWAFLKDVAKLIDYIASKTYIATAGEIWRTEYQQKHNVATGVSKTMNSNHLRRLAIDLNFFDKNLKVIETPQDVGDYWETLNPKNMWGGNYIRHGISKSFRDLPHFERRV